MSTKDDILQIQHQQNIELLRQKLEGLTIKDLLLLKDKTYKII